jgi:hypothetical protein
VKEEKGKKERLIESERERSEPKKVENMSAFISVMSNFFKETLVYSYTY